ncbi:hypothetical protein HY345_01560 [Candidatus Microgenomates bacterium]|nr:hypothetical protein [Candidatus Microgenomates bacterium]
MNELREGIVRTGVLGLALGGLIVGTEACANGVSEYSVAEVENQETFARSLKDRFSYPLVDLIKRPTPTPVGLDKNNQIDNFPELLDLVGQQTKQVLTYRREGSTFTFYLAEGAPVPSQSELDQSWDFLKSYTATPLIQRFKPVQTAEIFVAHYGPNMASGATGGRPEFSAFTIGLVNLDTSTTKDLNRTDMTEYCQSLFQSITTRLDVMLQERDCNMFGIAVRAVDKNLTYGEYQTFARQKGFVGNQPIELEPFSETNYNRIHTIFGPKIPPATPVPPMSNNNLRLYYAAVIAQINVSHRDFDSFTRKEMENVEDSFQFLKKTTKGKQKGRGRGNIIRGAINAATARLAYGAVV